MAIGWCIICSMRWAKLFKNSGFTIVEVLVIISVIAILASLANVGYIAYIQNANKSAISTTAHAYQSSLKSYTLEANTYPKVPFCLPGGSKCCYSSSVSPAAVSCGTDAESGWSAGSLASAVSKYVSGNPPKLPIFSKFIDCTGGLMSNGPCKATASIPVLGMTYIPNISGALYTSTDTSAKGFLIYYVDIIYTCNSGSVMTLSAGNLSFNSSAQYTREKTPAPAYRECIIGVRTN